jgi:spore maturation protein CgeB
VGDVVTSILICHPGSTISTADVFSGLVAGLKHHGANVISYGLHGRLQDSQKFLAASYRRAKKSDPTINKPQFTDVVYHASLGIYEKMLRFQVDAVIIVSGVLMLPDTLTLLRRTGKPIGVLLTESPYLMKSEQQIASRVDFVWTNERSAVADIAAVQPRTSYLPHAWLPGVHDQIRSEDVASHDVVFVGTGFPERIAMLEGVDWTGIDLGLYGNWRSVRPKSPIKPFVCSHEVPNTYATALYQHAKIGLNLYRTSMTTLDQQHITHAESLNPRAYELAACGSFHLSTPRAEVTEKFGDLVPTVTSAQDITTHVRYWLSHEAERKAVAAQLPARVAEDTWLARGEQVLGTIRGLTARAA